MPTMNISLPEQLKEHVETLVNSGHYTSASEYMRELVRIDIRNRERDRIEYAVLAGIHSGDLVEITPNTWDTLRNELELTEKAS